MIFQTNICAEYYSSCFFTFPDPDPSSKKLKSLFQLSLSSVRRTSRHFDDGFDKGFRFNSLTFAYRNIKENGLLFQIEPKIIYKNESDKFKRIETGLRMEIGGAIKKPIFKILHVRLGKFARVFYLNEQIEAEAIRFGSYPTTRNIGGIAFGPFIAFEIKLGKRFYLEANAAYTGLAIGVDYQYVDDPNRTERQRRTGGFDMDSFSERFFRLGFGVNL